MTKNFSGKVWQIVISVLFIVFLQFTFATPAGFPLTLGFLGLCVLGGFLCYDGSAAIAVCSWIGLAILFSFIQIWVLGLSQELLLEFLASTCLVLIFGSISLAAYHSNSIPRILRSRKFMTRGFSLVTITLLSFLLLQRFTWQFLGTDFFFGPLRSFSYLGVRHPPVTQEAIRCYAAYLEPSFCALVLNVCFACILILKHYKWRDVGVVFAGVLLTNSASGLLIFFLLCSMVIWLRFARKWILRATGILLTIVVFTSFQLYKSRDLASAGNDSSTGRFAEVATEGSSGYYRLIAPLVIVRDTLVNYPMGRGVGSIETVLDEYDFMNGNRRGTSLDNGIYVIIVYFGGLGACFVGWMFYSFLKSIIMNKVERSIAWFVLLSSLSVTGGLLTAEFILLMIITLLSYRLSVSKVVKTSRIRSGTPRVGLGSVEQ